MAQSTADGKSRSGKGTTSSKTPPANKPRQVFRIGYVSASIFARNVEFDDGSRVMHSVNLQKRFLDGDEVKYTSSLGLAELPQALRCLELAQQYIEAREADIPLD